MTNEGKDGLFLKVSIDNIKNGDVARIGLQRYGLLVVIASFADDKGECFPSQELLAELCGVGRKRINALIKELCEFRTTDGNPILIRNTVRKGQTKTVTDYKITQAAGIAFGANKIVPNRK